MDPRLKNQSTMASCQQCLMEGQVTLTSLGAIRNPAFKVVNADAFDGAHLIRSNGTITVLSPSCIEWLILTDNEASLIISVGNGQVKTVPVDKFYEQNAWFDKLAVKTNHEGCKKKLLKAGVSVL